LWTVAVSTCRTTFGTIHFRHPIFIGCVIHDGKAFLAQVGPARLSAVGRFRSTVDLVRAGITSRKEALQVIEPGDILSVSSPHPVASQLTAFSSGWRVGYEFVVRKL
jgi:hypothetical protein